jgi:hypothetical protein
MRRLIVVAAVALSSCRWASLRDQREGMRVLRAEAYAVEWLFELNQSEARFESRTKRFGSLEDLHMMLVPDGFSASFRLADATAYSAAFRPTGNGRNGYFTDQSMIIRRCPRSEKPSVSCPSIDEPILIAPKQPFEVPHYRNPRPMIRPEAWEPPHEDVHPLTDICARTAPFAMADMVVQAAPGTR